jgi:hypothetical protein
VQVAELYYREKQAQHAGKAGVPEVLPEMPEAHGAQGNHEA